MKRSIGFSTERLPWQRWQVRRMAQILLKALPRAQVALPIAFGLKPHQVGEAREVM